jgi:hypothetical protein
MVGFVQRPTPIYFIGDSFSLIFRDRVYTDGGSPPRAYQARILYQPGLALERLTAPDGRLHPHVEGALRAESLVVDTDNGMEAYHTTTHLHWRQVSIAEGRPRKAPIVVVMLGHFDVAAFEIREAANFSFELPTDCRPAPLPQAPEGRVIPLEYGLGRFNASIRPAIAGLQYLKGLGFNRILVHSVQPMPVEGEALARNALSRVTTGTRYAAMLLFNYALERACREAEIPFVDVWDDLTENGVLRDEFVHIDRVHLNEKAARISMEHLLRAIAEPPPIPLAL